MTWSEAIKLSKKKSATRSYTEDGFSVKVIVYSDSSAFKLVSKDGKVDFFKSYPIFSYDLDNYNDYEPNN